MIVLRVRGRRSGLRLGSGALDNTSRVTTQAKAPQNSDRVHSFEGAVEKPPAPGRAVAPATQASGAPAWRGSAATVCSLTAQEAGLRERSD
jgi:hypothetical protein